MRSLAPLVLALFVLPSIVAGQPKQCRSYTTALATCQSELAQYKPIVKPAVTGTMRVGETLTLTLTAPSGSDAEFATGAGDWEWVEISGGFLVTFTPDAAGLGRLAYRVLIGNQLEEYPVEITVMP